MEAERESRRDMLRMQAEHLRAERQRRQEQRLRLLKDINLKKINNQSLFLGSDTTFEKSFGDKFAHSKSFNFSFNSKAANVKSEKIDSGRKSMFPKMNSAPTKSNAKIEPKQNISRKSIMPKIESTLPKTTTNRQTFRKSVFPNTESNIKTEISRKTVLSKIDTGLSKPLINSSLPRKSFMPKPDTIPRKTSANLTENKSTSIKNITKNASALKNSATSVMINQKDTQTGNVLVKKNINSLVDRLSKPKIINKPPSTNIVLKKSILDKSMTKKPVEPIKKLIVKPTILKNSMKEPLGEISDFNQNRHLRRSLSTVHFKRSGSEATNQCIHRTSSMGTIKYKKIEDDISDVFPPKDYVLRVESERKKSVSFYTPIRKSSTPMQFLNTPKPSELRRRLNHWLQKRGKSLSMYHHLKCFGLHSHESKTEFDPLNEDEDENKENVEISDDDSFTEIIEGNLNDRAAMWRQANHQFADSPIVGEPSPKEICKRGGILKELSPTGLSKTALNPLVAEALFDLHKLILENYSWEQCAEWLRAIVREYGDNVKNISQYWECRAALEEKRGNFVDTVDCFNNALQHGAEQTHIEDALGNLLEKFMKLEVHPTTEKTQVPNQKLIDVKNIFKSSLIRFAIKMQDERENGENSSVTKKFTATPVRRSNRLSCVNETFAIQKRTSPATETKNHLKNVASHNFLKPNATPRSASRSHLVQLCNSLKSVDDVIKPTLVFVPNKALNFNDCM